MSRILTFLLPSSLRSKAHCCLHCSHVCGGPYFFSELVQRWHFVPINAAIILQYWQGLGCKMDKRTTQCNYIFSKLKQSVGNFLSAFTHCSKLFDILSTLLADSISFTVNNRKGVLFLKEMMRINATWDNHCKQLTFPVETQICNMCISLLDERCDTPVQTKQRNVSGQ